VSTINDLTGRSGRARTCDPRFWSPSATVARRIVQSRPVSDFRRLGALTFCVDPILFNLIALVWVQTWVQEKARQTNRLGRISIETGRWSARWAIDDVGSFVARNRRYTNTTKGGRSICRPSLPSFPDQLTSGWSLPSGRPRAWPRRSRCTSWNRSRRG
jgi:hypothetical protein